MESALLLRQIQHPENSRQNVNNGNKKKKRAPKRRRRIAVEPENDSDNSELEIAFSKITSSTTKPRNEDDDNDDDCIVIPQPPPEIIQIDSDNEYIPPHQKSPEKPPEEDLFFIDKGDDNVHPVALVPQYSIVSDTSLTFSTLEEGELAQSQPSSPPKDPKPRTPVPASPHVEIIDLDKTIMNASAVQPCDESVIFVSEETAPPATAADDFISLYNELRFPKPKRKVTPVKKASKKVKKKRMIVVDGNNVAMHHGAHKSFSVEGLKIVIDYFEGREYEVKVIVPQYRVKPSKSTNRDLLEKLAREGKVLLTPCKNLGPGNVSASYDDRFILQIADECDAAIISNDNFRDLLQESPKWKEIIQTRVVGFMWCNNTFLLPQDPYGRQGPKLDDILYTTVESSTAAETSKK